MRIVRMMLNKSITDLYLGRNLSINAKNYDLGKNVHASIKKPRDNMGIESNLLMEDHKVKGNRLIAYADGSTFSINNNQTPFILRRLLKWFNSLSKEELENPKLMEEKANLFIRELNQQIVKEFPNTCSSLSFAIIGEDKTLLVSIGDSFIFTRNGKELNLAIENDQRLAESMMKKEQLSDEQKNFLSIGLSNYLGRSNMDDPNIKTIDTDMKGLLITSFGIVKSLSFDDMRRVLNTEEAIDVPETLIRLSSREELQDFGYSRRVATGDCDLAAVIVSEEVDNPKRFAKRAKRRFFK